MGPFIILTGDLILEQENYDDLMELSDTDLLNSPEEGELVNFGMDLNDIFQGGSGQVTKQPDPEQEGGMWYQRPIKVKVQTTLIAVYINRPT